MKHPLVSRGLPLAALALVVGLALVTIPVANTWWVRVMGVSGDVNSAPLPSPTSEGDTSVEAHKSAFGSWQKKQGLGVDHLLAEVHGEICVHNTGDYATRDLNIFDQLEYLDSNNQYTPLERAGMSIKPDQQIGPGETRCFPYQFEFSPHMGARKYRNMARVSIGNHHLSGMRVMSADCEPEEECTDDATAQADFELDSFDPVVEPTAVLLSPTPTAPPVPAAEIQAQLESSVRRNGELLEVSSHLDVKNTGVVPAEGLAMKGQVYVADANGNPGQAVSSAWKWSSSSPLPVGDSLANYFLTSFTPQDGQHYLMQVQVRIDNYTGWLPGRW